jgi:hypothetical protein
MKNPREHEQTQQEESPMKKGKLFLTLAVLALVSGFLVGHFTVPPAGALSTTDLKVKHSTIYGYNVAADDGYTVEYRLYDTQIPPFGGWQDWEDAVDKTDTGESVDSCSPYGICRWKYTTNGFDEQRYTAVEWRIYMIQGREGTRCSDGADQEYCESGWLNKTTWPGGTASITAGCYQTP